MFVGMSFCLPLAFLLESRKRKRAQKAAAAAGTASEPLLANGVSQCCPLPGSAAKQGNAAHPAAIRFQPRRQWLDRPSAHPPAACLQGSAPAGAGGEGHSELAQALMLCIPTAFDLIATVLMNVGLLSGGRASGGLKLAFGAALPQAAEGTVQGNNHSSDRASSCYSTAMHSQPAVTASVYQMMRGAEMLFAALFAVVFLRRRCGRWACLTRRCCHAPASRPQLGRALV